MDKRHRHELEENDLVSFATSAKDKWERYGLQFLVAALVVVVAYTAMTWYRSSRNSAHEQELRDLETASSPDAYRTVAQDVRTPNMAALAYLRGADAALAKVALPPTTPPPNPAASQPAADAQPLTAQGRKQFLDDAEMMYREVVDKPGVAALLKLNAKMGLAAVAESRSDWDKARDLYKEVIAGANSYAMVKAKAEGHLALVDHLQTPVIYAPEPLPATAPAMSGVLPDVLGKSIITTPAEAPATRPATAPATAPTMSDVHPASTPTH